MSIQHISDNDIKKAVALFYDGHNAPIISAKGKDTQAEEILRIAQEHDIPLCDNAALVNILCELELGDHIPKALYLSIAHIISFAYQLTLTSQEDHQL